MKRVAPKVISNSSIQHRLERTIRLCSSSRGNEQTNAAVSSQNMLSNSTVIWMMGCIVTVKRLRFCARSNAKDNCVVELRYADALFVLVANPIIFDMASEQSIGDTYPKSISDHRTRERRGFAHQAKSTSSLWREEVPCDALVSP